MKLRQDEEDVILHILKYWLDHWDFECPTLFGISESQMEQVVSLWPKGFRENDKITAIAIAHGFGELLWGASSVTSSKSMSVFNWPKSKIESLYGKIENELRKYRDE